MRFEETLRGWQEKEITQKEAARLLGVDERTFRRYLKRYEESGMEGLQDRRISEPSKRRAPGYEVQEIAERYRARHQGWSARHYFSWYRRAGGKRSYTFVKERLQDAALITKERARGQHRKRREACPYPGMMIHQDGSTHEWVEGKRWDLIVTMDDATNEHYSMFFVDEEGTESSMRGVREVIEAKGLFCSFYSDRGSHYWHTPHAGGKVDKQNLTQFGRAMQHLGIEMIAAYSPEARGRSERAFATHQARLPKELALMGIRTQEAANRYLKEAYLPAFNAEFAHAAREEGSAFVPYTGMNLEEILCEQYERKANADNCVQFRNLIFQIPADTFRCNYVKTTITIHRYGSGSYGLFHGPRLLAHYDATGRRRETGTTMTADIRSTAAPREGLRATPSAPSLGLEKADNSCAKKTGQFICY